MGYLNQHLLGHTNARLGYIFANREIELVELFILEGGVDVEPVLEGCITVTPELEGEWACQPPCQS